MYEHNLHHCVYLCARGRAAQQSSSRRLGLFTRCLACSDHTSSKMIAAPCVIHGGLFSQPLPDI